MTNGELDLIAFWEHRHKCSCNTDVPDDQYQSCDECRYWRLAGIEISRAILSGINLTENELGSYAQSKVAEEIRQGVINEHRRKLLSL